jgi:hypothetical protein
MSPSLPTPESSPEEVMIACAYSGRMGLKSQMVQIGSDWILSDVKDEYVEALRQGASSQECAPPKQPRSVFWARVVLVLQGFVGTFLAVRAVRHGFGQPSAIIGTLTYEVPVLFAAYLLWQKPRHRAGYYLASVMLCWMTLNGLRNGLLFSKRLYDPITTGTMIFTLLVFALLPYRFIFGSASRNYFGFKTKAKQ